MSRSDWFEQVVIGASQLHFQLQESVLVLAIYFIVAIAISTPKTIEILTKKNRIANPKKKSPKQRKPVKVVVLKGNDDPSV